jgi:arsenite methyltransferase
MSTTMDGNGKSITQTLDVESAVRERYSAASRAPEPMLCCPIPYETKHLDVLPRELIERDYGCGDPSKYVAEGETVLDLGSGGGKICYIASQIVGPRGRVFGVDMNDDMLALARKYRREIGDRIGWHNVEFFKGRIQDLALDLDRFESHLQQHPVRGADQWLEAQRHADRLRHDQPMIASGSVDVVLSNCVLNLVTPQDRRQLFAEMYRVLKRGGRAVISDIVSDEPVPGHLKNDPQLWSGCISGAFVEHEFLEAFEDAGFYGMEIVTRQVEPWATVEGIEFRSMTVRAYKGKDGPCMDHKQGVIYQGPWKSVTDDDGHVLRRGVRTAVCEKTFNIYTHAPYAEQVIPVPSLETVAPEDAQPYDCRRNAVRDPHETKGAAFAKTQLPVANCCGPGEC